MICTGPQYGGSRCYDGDYGLARAQHLHVYTAQLAEKIPGSVWFNTFDEVAQYVVDHAQKGDLVITLGCGDIYKAAKLMIQKYEEQGADVNRDIGLFSAFCSIETPQTDIAV